MMAQGHARRDTRRKRGAGRQPRGSGGQKWSAEVTEHSNALSLEPKVFTFKDPRRIARSLKQSAEESNRRKSSPYRSAMSMLTFYINRAGDDLPDERRRVLERAKGELRKAFGKA